MANHFPTIPSYAVADVTYTLALVNNNLDINVSMASQANLQTTFDSEAAYSGNNAEPGDQYYGPLFSYVITFDTYTVDDGNEVYDYSGFDQDTVESALVTFANSLISALATLTGVSADEFSSSFALLRQWTYTASSGNTSGDYAVFEQTLGDQESISLS